MATTPGGTSIEDIMEDLQLHQALLQSLMESRPEACEEAQELQTAIRDLNRKLAQCRGEPLESLRPPSSRSSTAMPQFDGSGEDDLGNPASWRTGNRPISPLDVPEQNHENGVEDLYPRLDLAGTSASLPSRKRPYHLSDLVGPSESSSSSKRISSRESPPSTPMSVQSFTDGTSVFNDSTEELQRLLGLDNQTNLRAMQQEQRQAEKWLEERKEQERRDAEFARSLQTSWMERDPGPSRPSSPSSFSSVSFSSVPAPVRQFNVTPTKRPSEFHPELPPLTHYPHYQSNLPGHGSVFHPQKGFQTFGDLSSAHHRLNPTQTFSVTPLNDSSDSDIAEISPLDFQSNVRQSSMMPSWRSSTHIRPDGDMLDEAMHLAGMKRSQSHGFLPRTPFGGHDQAGFSSNVVRNAYNRLVEAGKGVFAGTSVKHGLGDSVNDGDRPSTWPYDSSLLDSYDSPLGDNKHTTEEIKELLENLRPDVDLGKEHREDTPEAVKFPLLEHQKLGLSWMKTMEEGTNKGGILADDMGLGKTMQALALMVSRQSSEPGRKTNLIIAPVALMQQWKREIERMLKPAHALRVFILHGEKRNTRFDDLKKYDVVLTTFGTLASELKRRDEWEKMMKHAGPNSANFVAEASSLPVLGPHCTWYRVIIDEAQCIKNRNTKAALACCYINTTYRWCMSGTPMMNNVGELHSLIKFLRIRPYNNLEQFNKDFTRPLKSGNKDMQTRALQQLQVLLKAILLRRTKTSKIDGKPILQLPPRVTEKVHAVFNEDEQELYNALENKTQIQFNRYLEAGTIGRNYSNILVLLLRLRQACCHPHLINDLSIDVSAATADVDLVENAKQFGPDVVRRLQENAPLECPVCIDAVENAVIFYPCGHATCAECFARISDPALAIQQGNNDGQVDVKCPNCRAKIDPKKVTDNVSFKKVHFPEQSGSSANQESEATDKTDVDGSDSDSDDEEDSDEDDGSDLRDFIVPDAEYDSAEAKSSTKEKSKKKKKGKGKEPQRVKKTLAVLKKEGQKNAAAKRRYLNRLEKTWIASAKVDKAVEVLQETEDAGQGEKTIVFSQFTSLLDLLEIPISRKGWRYRRYDGSMRPADRNDAVMEFTDDPECKIMLVSLKAGNSGLNLVAASHVIIFDPFWNPYIEEQAIDRAHRMGQMRPVHVHRLLVEKTVEDRILELQDKKREIIEGALDERAGKEISRLGARELKFLFNIP